MNSISSSLNRSDRRLIGILCLLFLFGNMNITMFNLAIPSIAASFTLTSSQVSWVMVGYSILMAIGAGTYGKLTESYSIRYLYVIGLFLFAIGSIVGFFAPSYLQVTVGRLLQAAGASAISPLSYAIATVYFSSGNRGQALGALSASIAFASGFGPVFGGFIEQYAGWHSLFLVSGASFLLVPLILKYVPDLEHPRGTFDIFGAVLFSAGLACILLGVTMHWLYLFSGAALLAGFYFHIQKADQPFIQVSFLRNAPFLRILWIGFLTFVCNTGLFFLLPFVMKQAFHLPSSTIGILVLPGAAVAAMLGSSIGRWADHFGSSWILKISHYSLISGFILLGLSASLPPWVDSLVVIILMLAFNGLLTASGNLVSATLSAAELGIGMGIFTLFYLLGGAFGPALAGRLIDLNIPFSIIYYIFAMLGILSYWLIPEIKN